MNCAVSVSCPLATAIRIEGTGSERICAYEERFNDLIRNVNAELDHLYLRVQKDMPQEDRGLVRAFLNSVFVNFASLLILHSLRAATEQASRFQLLKILKQVATLTKAVKYEDWSLIVLVSSSPLVLRTIDLTCSQIACMEARSCCS